MPQIYRPPPIGYERGPQALRDSIRCSIAMTAIARLKGDAEDRPRGCTFAV